MTTTPETTPDELLDLADQLFDSRRVHDRTRERGIRLIGEVPLGPGRILSLVRESNGHQPPKFSFRVFAVTPIGGRIPLSSYGFPFHAGVVAHVAGLLAQALRVELAELPNRHAPSGHDGAEADDATGARTVCTEE